MPSSPKWSIRDDDDAVMTIEVIGGEVRATIEPIGRRWRTTSPERVDEVRDALAAATGILQDAQPGQ